MRRRVHLESGNRRKTGVTVEGSGPVVVKKGPNVLNRYCPEGPERFLHYELTIKVSRRISGSDRGGSGVLLPGLGKGTVGQGKV